MLIDREDLYQRINYEDLGSGALGACELREASLGTWQTVGLMPRSMAATADSRGATATAPSRARSRTARDGSTAGHSTRASNASPTSRRNARFTPTSPTGALTSPEREPRVAREGSQAVPGVFPSLLALALGGCEGIREWCGEAADAVDFLRGPFRDAERGGPAVEPGYHPVGACAESLTPLPE